MKKLKKSSIVIALVLSALVSNSASAWNDTVTHPALTDLAIKHLQLSGWIEPYLQNNLGFEKNVEALLPYENKQITIRALLLEGSREEDSPLSRSFNHFHEPISNLGLNQLCWPFNPDKCVWKGESALGWARGTGEGCREAEKCTGNEYSWFEARYHYRLAFEAESATDRDRELADTFRILGQIMHLVQDMAVPAHTRNGVA